MTSLISDARIKNTQLKKLRKKKGKRFERNGRKASGLKLSATMIAELLFQMVLVPFIMDEEPFLSYGRNGSFFQLLIVATHFAADHHAISEAKLLTLHVGNRT